MKKIILISNRLPVNISKKKNSFDAKPSIGGLATGLKSVYEKRNSIWLGWSGLTAEEVTAEQKSQIADNVCKNYKCIPLFLPQADMQLYYFGFSNNTIWPLFHYFTDQTDFNHETWHAYKKVNRLFFKGAKDLIKPGDDIWIHDYQLMLLPRMIKDRFPDNRVGFFLHIPFPSFEVFRLLPWRDEILQGLLGADLIGFHTYDYVRHFLSSVRRLLGLEHNLGSITLKNRIIKSDVFPMGVDYKKYAEAYTKKVVKSEIEEMQKKVGQRRVILSIDRLDYTKGIPQRLKAFDAFLNTYPNYKEKISLLLIVAPSRTKVSLYKKLKREVDELVSNINSKHATMGWMPIWYFFRSFPFNKLIALYKMADILMVTPLRDGMNLIAKEYLASKSDNKGVLIISETAGAARELGEALIVNANNIEQIAAAIKAALELPVEDIVERNIIMKQRLQRYDIEYWSKDFLDKLEQTQEQQEQLKAKRLNPFLVKSILKKYKKAQRRLLLLDYDGTLRSFEVTPKKAVPDKELLVLLSSLAKNESNELVIVSGRDKATLDAWFREVPGGLVAGHGIWFKEHGADWQLQEVLDNSWKEVIRPLLEIFTDRTPGSMVEEKTHSLAWHYRKSEPELAAIRVSELKDALLNLTDNYNLGFMNGHKVIEIKDMNINKGVAVSRWMMKQDWDFVFAAGDDNTDEDMFAILPETAVTIRVGYDISNAHYMADSVDEIRELLVRFNKVK
jgi:trehalose 6-phosphate synthase/phosphatase